MRCADCAHWFVREVTTYDDGSEIVTRQATEGKGACFQLNFETDPEFGCTKFEAGDEHVVTTHKAGAPWQHFVMIPCPACQGGPNCGGRCQCAGTGKVRLYDDGFVGEEMTRLHPKEKALLAQSKPVCRRCNTELEHTWVACPACGERVYIPVAKTEVIDGLGNSGIIPGMEQAVQAVRAEKAETLRSEINEQNTRSNGPA